MELVQLQGSGLIDVWLLGGFEVREFGNRSAIAYRDLDGLYSALAHAIALQAGALRSDELRFLRKRLGWTQEQVGALGGKTDQVVAKWEKGQLAVPLAESNLLRLAWLSRFAKKDISKLVGAMSSRNQYGLRPPIYLMVYQDGKWLLDEESSWHFVPVVASKQTSALLQNLRAPMMPAFNGASVSFIESQVTYTSEAPHRNSEAYTDA